MTPTTLGRQMTLPNHNGEPVDTGDLYGGAPGDQLGRVLSASTSDTTRPGGKQIAQLIALRVLAAMVAAAVGAGVAWGLCAGIEAIGLEGEPLMPFAIPAVALLFAVAAFVLVKQKRVTSFVGTEGVYRVQRRGSKETIDWIRWSDVESLKASQTRSYTNGVYTGTTVGYHWSDASGRKRFSIAGHFAQQRSDDAPRGNPVHFAYAAEQSWTLWRIGQMDARLQRDGVLRYPAGGKTVAVGEGFLELTAKGTTERVSTAEIESVELQSGTLTITRKGARKGLFSSEGVFRVGVGDMANFRCFLVAMQRYAGVSF